MTLENQDSFINNHFLSLSLSGNDDEGWKQERKKEIEKEKKLEGRNLERN